MQTLLPVIHVLCLQSSFWLLTHCLKHRTLVTTCHYNVSKGWHQALFIELSAEILVSLSESYNQLGLSGSQNQYIYQKLFWLIEGCFHLSTPCPRYTFHCKCRQQCCFAGQFRNKLARYVTITKNVFCIFRFF